MTTLDGRQLLRALWRRKLWILLPALAGLGAGLALLEVMTPVYRASTLVLVEAQKVPEDYVKATVTTTLQDRLKTLEQQVTNRNNIVRIIRERGLYPELVEAGRLDDAITATRNALGIQVQGNKVFRIDFDAADPEVAAATANRLAELFIEQNLRLRRSQARGTAAFLASELEHMKTELEAQERAIADFKRLHIEELPEQRETNLRAVEQLQAKLQINLDARDKAEQRKLYLQRESASSTPAAAAAAGPTRLEQLRAELAELRSRYTDRHPEVVRMSAELARLERAPEPVREAPVAVESANSFVLRGELAAVGLEIRQLAAEGDRIQQDIAGFQARLERTPHVELRLLDLTRDYDNLRESYEQLLAKRMDAELAENLEERQQSEQFIVLEAALPPAQPHSPNRPLVAGGGLLLGLALGVALAFLRQETDRTYSTADELRAAFPGVRLLGDIPTLSSPKRGPALLRRAAS